MRSFFSPSMSSVPVDPATSVVGLIRLPMRPAGVRRQADSGDRDPFPLGFAICSQNGYLRGSCHLPPMRTFDFCLPTSATSVPDHPVWLHEVKYDGYRLRLERDGHSVRLITRGGYNWS